MTSFQTLLPPSFDVTAYCRTLQKQVADGEITFELANALWRKYAVGVQDMFPNLPPLPSCPVGALIPSLPRDLGKGFDSGHGEVFPSQPLASPPPSGGPVGGVLPGLRDPSGPLAPFRPWAAFSPTDLDLCYPMPGWVAARLRDFPQRSQGDDLRAPLPLPFTAEEVRQALDDVRRASRGPQNRRCADVAASSVRIAMLVLPILERRNGGWIDVHLRGGDGMHLACMLFRLAGKPLPPAYDRCAWTPPRRDRLYRVRDVATTYDPRALPADDAGSLPSRSGLPPAPIGRDFEAIEVSEAEHFTHSLFEVSEVYQIRGG